jgi:thiamine pyrophosphokinase
MWYYQYRKWYVLGICYIFGALTSAIRPEIKAGDFVIAADAGYAKLEGIKPDIVVGDFDSLGYIPKDKNIVRHPEHKDDTDTMLAVKLGLEKGYKRFVILGGLGGRLDHTIANIHVLSYLTENGARGCLLGENENIIMIKNSYVSFSLETGGIFSAFAYGNAARGVRLDGFLYPLKSATLTCAFPLGVSNRFTGKKARVSVSDGCLLVIWNGEIEKTDFFEDLI